MTEGEIVGWLANSIDMIEEVPGVSDGQESLACCGPWGRKELNTNE